MVIAEKRLITDAISENLKDYNFNQMHRHHYWDVWIQSLSCSEKAQLCYYSCQYTSKEASRALAFST